jgi:hypothetical protein
MNKENLIALVFIFLLIIYVVYLHLPYKPTPLIMRLKYKLSLVDPKFAKYDIRESSSSSYTENKSTIYICCKDPKTGLYYDDDVLIYVCLHECAHVLSSRYGHHDQFKEIFRNLLDKARQVGVYKRGTIVPKNYCGLK